MTSSTDRALREISQDFIRKLQEGGEFHPILETVNADDTLMLAFRDGYINIYYRGSALLKLSGTGKVTTDKRFMPDGVTALGPLASVADAQALVRRFSEIKAKIDAHQSSGPKLEREFQQLVARQNSFNKKAFESEYFITDIEFALPTRFTEEKLQTRFDMIGFRWASGERGKGNPKITPVVAEMKFGGGAISGSASVIKHLNDWVKLLDIDEVRRTIRETIAAQFRQYVSLGLISSKGYDPEKTIQKITSSTLANLEIDTKFEAIFIFAGYNPRSTALELALKEIKEEAAHISSSFDLKFYVSSFAGYSMHGANMVDLDTFIELVQKLAKS